MSDPLDSESDSRLQFLRELEEEDTWIDGDVVEIDNNTWAIHGVIPYDGEVPIAVFESYDEAKHVLDDISAATRPTSDHRERPMPQTFTCCGTRLGRSQTSGATATEDPKPLSPATRSRVAR